MYFHSFTSSCRKSYRDSCYPLPVSASGNTLQNHIVPCHSQDPDTDTPKEQNMSVIIRALHIALYRHNRSPLFPFLSYLTFEKH